MLRRDLSVRAHHLARAHTLLHDVSPGASQVVIFGRDEEGRHGNFHPAAYKSICANPEWARRLTKVHTASRRSRARKDWRWMELDSANSSDALLMNIFCHPKVFDGKALAQPVASLLNVDPAVLPCFGARPGVPLRSGLFDRTEIDLTLGDLLVEAKLTENDFQNATLNLIERYRDFEAVFDIDRLPRKTFASLAAAPAFAEDDSFLNVAHKPVRMRIQGYQLIRNVLAAFASNGSFCVLSDARRHDLIETWYSVLSAVHARDFAWRLKLLTWQELAAVLPAELQKFLDAKYGIQPA
jgi:hypothetical protein